LAGAIYMCALSITLTISMAWRGELAATIGGIASSVICFAAICGIGYGAMILGSEVVEGLIARLS